MRQDTSSPNQITKHQHMGGGIANPNQITKHQHMGRDTLNPIKQPNTYKWGETL